MDLYAHSENKNNKKETVVEHAKNRPSVHAPCTAMSKTP